MASRYFLPVAMSGREEPCCTPASFTRKGLFGVFRANEGMWEKTSLQGPWHPSLLLWPAAQQGLTILPGEQGLVQSLWEMKREAAMIAEL